MDHEDRDSFSFVVHSHLEQQAFINRFALSRGDSYTLIHDSPLPYSRFIRCRRWINDSIASPDPLATIHVAGFYPHLIASETFDCGPAHSEALRTKQ